MEEDFAKLQEEWDFEEAERQLSNVLEDINAANLTKKSLENRKYQLAGEKRLLDIQINELRSELEALEESTQNYRDEQSTIEEQRPKGTFFSAYSQLEEEVHFWNAQLEAVKSLRGDLRHRLSVQKQQFSMLQKEIVSVKETTLSEANVIKDLNNIVIDLSTRLDKKRQEMFKFRNEKFELDGEIKKLIEKINRMEVKMEVLPKELKQLQEEYQELQSQIATHSNEFEKLRKVTEVEITKSKNDIENATSVNVWLSDRMLLMGKLRKTRMELEQELENFNNNKKHIERLEHQISSLLGPDESTERGKLMAVAELFDRQRLREKRNTEKDIDKIENNYKSSLERQIKILEKSLQDFCNYRDAMNKELEVELENALGNGYLNLLKNELRGINAMINKVV